MRNTKFLILLFSLFFGIEALLASVPPNWTVNSSSYTYNMTLTAQVELNCEQSVSLNDTIAAFVGGECRGVAPTSTVGGNGVLNFALMFLHSNNNAGDVVTFKYYDSDEDLVYNLSQTVNFFADSTLGTPSDPFQILGTYHPTAIELSNTVIYDTTDVNDVVGEVTVIDPDAGDVYALELLEVLDHDHFHLDGTDLKVSAIPNVVSDSLYKVVVTGTFNNTCVITDTLEIQLINTYVEPVFMAITNDTIFDYSEVGDTVGEFSLVNVPENGVEYTLMDTLGTDYGYFVMVDNYLVLNHEIDILTETSYDVFVRAHGGTNHYVDSIFVIKINNTNTPPTAMHISNDTVFDYSIEGEFIGDLSVDDENADANYTFSFDAGGSHNNDYFILVDNELYLNHDIDILTETEYLVHLKAYDGVAYSIDSIFTITLNNTNDEPTELVLSNDTVFDYSESGDLIGMFTTIDEDTNAVYTYSFDASGTHNNDYFILTGNELHLNHNINILTETEYLVHVKAYDGVAYSIDSIFTIKLNNTNIEPSEIIISNDTVFDYSESGDFIGEINVIDENDDAVYTLSFDPSGTHNNDYFILTGNELHLNHNINILTETEYLVHIKAYDGVAYSIDSIFTIKLNNTNDEPTELVLSNDTVFDYSESGDLIGMFTTIDEDTNAVYTYSFDASGTHNNDYFILTGNELHLNHNINILTETEYLVHVKAYDGVAYSIDSIFTIKLNNTNIQPSEITISNDTVFDYSESGDFIGEINVIDENDDAVYTLSFDPSGTHNNDYFILTGNELHLNHNINILTETEYLVHLKAYDGVAYSIDSIFTIKLNNTNTPPTAIELSANVVYDYSTPGDVVGNISVADENDDAVYTLSPLDSTALDNSKFSLVGTTLILDHQVDASIESVYQVQLKAYDGVAYWITDTLSIVVNNTNIFPYSLDVSGLSVYDYSVVGDTVGMLSVQDANIGETYTYTMTPNPSFFLLGNHIVLNQNINVLNDTSFDVTISAYDGSTWTIDSTYTVNVVNTNAEPTEVTISNAVIYDHTLPATLVGTFAVTDANGNIPYDYTLQNSYNSNLFQIVDNKLFLMGNVDPQIGSYQIEVSAYDGVLWTIDSLFTITVTNTNIEPTAIHISNDTIFNYTTPGDVVGYFNVDDVNAGTSYTYSLGTSLNESLFTIIGNTLKCNATIDPQAGSYQIQVSAFDGSQWTIDSVMTIVVNNTNEVPTAINLSNTTITDQTMVGDVVGGLTVTDANATEVYTYSINSAIQDGSLFQIVGNDLQFTGTVDPQIGSYQVQIEAYDGSQWTIDSLFTITVNNTNAVPTAIHLSNTEISDLTQAGDAVGQLSVTDANATETYTYSITTAIQDGSLFQVVGNELQFTGTVDPQAGSYQVQVEAYDGSQWMIDSLFTITVNNTNVKPTVFNLSATQVTDQTTTGSQVGTLSVTDANATENYTYTIKTGYNADHFQLVGNSLQFVGQVDVSKANYQVELEAYDGKLWTIDSVFTINVNNTNAAPTAITLSNNVITDMSGVGSEIGTFAVVDADASETYELTLSTELDGDKFSLVNDKLVFLTSFDPSETSYHIKISGYDGRQHSIDSTFTIEVNNTNPAPESLSISNNNIDENAPSQTLAGELTVADNGFNEVHTFELTFTEGENDNFEFELIGNKIYSKTSFDYENQTEYTVEVTVTDVVNNTLTEVFTINVNDVLEVDVLENNNYLTPNADGVNDVWEVENVELYENFTLNIYNKQGQSVYQTTGYNNTWSGSDLPTGIYFYHFKSNKNSVEFSGNIHLIK